VLPVNCKNNVEPLVTSAAKDNHPFGAVGSVIVPLEAPPEPTTILNTNVLTAVIVGLVPNPEPIVGNVFEVAIKLPPIDNVAGFSVLPLNGGENTAPPGPIKPVQAPAVLNVACTGNKFVTELFATPGFAIMFPYDWSATGITYRVPEVPIAVIEKICGTAITVGCDIVTPNTNDWLLFPPVGNTAAGAEPTP